ncbi:MAG: hypothetical protein ACOX7B_05525 [Christensenellales bacterium]
MPILVYYAKNKRDSPKLEQTGVATSTDMLNWTGMTKTHIAVSPGGWDGVFASNPAAMHCDGVEDQA